MSKKKNTTRRHAPAASSPFKPVSGRAPLAPAAASARLAQAMKHHQEGRVHEAETLYRKLLADNPQHVDALHLMGVIAFQRNDNARAVELIGRAIALHAGQAAFHSNLGNALLAQNHLETAIAAYETALCLDPDHVEARYNLGVAFQAQGDLAGAAVCFEHVIRLQPDHASAHNNLGVIRQAQEDLPAALVQFEAALRIRPGYAIARNNQGNVLLIQENVEAAVTAFQEALRYSPDYVEAHHNLSKALKEQGDLDAAIFHAEEALRLRPGQTRTHNDLGILLQTQKQWDKALFHYQEALRLSPDDINAHNNMGILLDEQGDLAGAQSFFQQALRLNPENAMTHNNRAIVLQAGGEIDGAIASLQEAVRLDQNYADGYCNLGLALTMQGRFEEAITAYQRSLALKPNLVAANFNLSIAQLRTGDLENGWKQYAWRWRSKDRPPRPFPYPEWDGGPLVGKTVLVYAEQGVGDEILFASCLPELIRQAGKVILECDPRLSGLFARAFPRALVCGASRADQSWLKQVPPIDVQVAMGNLPQFLRTDLSHFPSTGGFLVADPNSQAHWRAQVDGLGPGLKVGLSWRSMLRGRMRDRNYSVLDQWQAVFAVPGVVWVNLQYDQCEDELAEAERRFGIKIHNIHSKDGLDLKDDLGGAADLTSVLDLVIAPANSVGAMAGALGVDVWTLLVYEGDWGSLGTDRFPWFPSMRLFPQVRSGDWDSTLTQVARELETRAVKAGSARVSSSRSGKAAQARAAQAAALCAQAREPHQAGRLAEAEALYQQALAHDPQHAEVLHLLGVLAYQRGQHEAAVRHIEQAIALPGAQPAFYSNLGNALAAQGDWAAARAAYETALRLKPDYLEARYNLGAIFQNQGDLAQAASCFEHVARLQPEHVDAHRNLGVVLQAQGHLDAAVAHYQEAARLEPDHVLTQNTLGVLLNDRSDFAGAARCFEQVVRLRPDDAEAHRNLAMVLQQDERLEEARFHFQETLHSQPNDVTVLNNLGRLLRAQGEWAEAHSYLERALRLNPEHVGAHNNRGFVFLEQADLAAATACFQEAVRLDPNNPEANCNLAMTHLATGDLGRGWQHYAWRWQCKDRAPRSFSFPPWDGGSLANKTILVYAEQGVGDEILFASCLPDLICQAKLVVIECEPRLAPLYARSFPQARVYGAHREDQSWLAQAPPIDVQVAIGSLPPFLRADLSRFPSVGGFLVADPERQAHWRAQLADLGPGLKVGISWRSMLRSSLRNRHYSALEQWQAVFAVPGVVWVNLQYDQCEDELAQAQRQFGIGVHVVEGLDLKDDLDGAAALTAALDLVIAPSNSVGAMAGALGIDVWTLLVHEGDWGSLGTDRFPWFPSMRLFRQAQPGDWPSALAQVARELQTRADAAMAAKPATGGIGEKHRMIGEVFSLALQQHQDGHLAEAETLYRKILERDAQHAPSLHLLGVLAHQVGQNETAIGLMRAAIALQNGEAMFHQDLGVVLQAQGDLPAAIAEYERALALDPNFTEARDSLRGCLEGTAAATG